MRQLWEGSKASTGAPKWCSKAIATRAGRLKLLSYLLTSNPSVQPYDMDNNVCPASLPMKTLASQNVTRTLQKVAWLSVLQAAVELAVLLSAVACLLHMLADISMT